MKLAELVAELDAYFRIPDVRGDDWSATLEHVYPEPYWRAYAAAGWEGRWNGLAVGGADEVERVATCVFPSDRIVEELEPRTFLFSEHPVDFADEPGFLPLSRAAYESMQAKGISFYNAHAPLDMHPELTVDGLADALRSYLGPEILVHVLTRARAEAGRVAMVAGGGAVVEILEESLERGCDTYVTGNAATTCRLDFVQEQVRVFRERADEAGVALIDAMHYGMEKPPQIAMLGWFRARGLEAEFVPDGPK